MTKIELKTFRRALEHRQAELENENRNREALSIETSSDELDRIQCAGNRDWVMANLERNSEHSREVRMALRRMDAGTFGICVACDENINPKRIAAVPWASSCIVCQEAADRERVADGNELEPSLVMAS
jgi:DnaK suppressor protein